MSRAGGALAAIMLVGLAIRLSGLTSYGIWFDESYHIALVQLPSVGAMLDAVLSNPPSDPLYVLLLRPWVVLFGHGDGAVRALSVGLSTATLPATYWLGRSLAGPRAGLLGAALLAVSPYAVELGQEAALYALAALTTTLALAAGWHWWRTGQGARRYLALGVIAIYSHYVVAAILAGFALLVLLPGGGPRQVSRRAWLTGHAAIGAAWLPWLAALAIHWLQSAVPRATLQHRAGLADVRDALIQYTSGTTAMLHGPRALQVLGLLAAAGLLLGGWLAGRDPRRRGLRLLLLLSGVVFLAPALVSALTGRWLFVPHFMLFLLPAIFVVLAASYQPSAISRQETRGQWSVVSGQPSVVSQVPGPPLRQSPSGVSTQHLAVSTPHSSQPSALVSRLSTPYASLVSRLSTQHAALSTALLVGWLVAQVGGLALYYRDPPHGADGARELAAVLRQDARPTDVVLVTPPALMPTVQQYYAGPLRGLPSDFDLRAVYLPYDPARWNADSLAVTTAALPGHPRAWLVYRPELDAGGSFLASLQACYRQVDHRPYPFADLYLFAIP
jgi:4-amino-4-deoxy-L-arabinose transferase-like glycosyltransferase